MTVSPLRPRTLFSILAVLKNALVWMVSTRLPTSKSSSPFNNPLVTVPKAPILIGIIVPFMFHSFFVFAFLFCFVLFCFPLFQFLTILHRVFTQDPARGKVVIICIQCIYIFAVFFLGDNFSVTLIAFYKRDVQLREVQLFVLHIGSDRQLYSLTHLLLSAGTDISIRKHIFLLESVMNIRIWSITLYFSISLDSKVLENNNNNNNNNYYYHYFNPFGSFSHQHQLMVFHWNLSDIKFSQVSRTLLGILADLNSTAVWMIYTRVIISNSSSPFTNPLVIVPSAPITIDITITFLFHNLFSVP